MGRVMSPSGGTGATFAGFLLDRFFTHLIISSAKITKKAMMKSSKTTNISMGMQCMVCVSVVVGQCEEIVNAMLKKKKNEKERIQSQ